MNNEEMELFKNKYLQHPISYLTEENIDKLEQHCEKTINYATGRMLKEHQVTLELIKRYKETKEEMYAIAKANYDVGMLEERSQWYKKINEISSEYQEKMKNDKDCKNIFNANNIRQEVITVLNNRLIGKEE